MSAEDMLLIVSAAVPGTAFRGWAKQQQPPDDYDEGLDSATPSDLDPLRRYDLQATFLHRVRRRARIAGGRDYPTDSNFYQAYAGLRAGREPTPDDMLRPYVDGFFVRKDEPPPTASPTVQAPPTAAPAPPRPRRLECRRLDFDAALAPTDSKQVVSCRTLHTAQTYSVGQLRTVVDGHLVGFVGGNGAGKTTTMRMIMGLLAPDSGQVNLNGRPITTACLCSLPIASALAVFWLAMVR